MMRAIAATAASMFVAFAAPAGATSETSALNEAGTAFAKVDDYRMTIAVHETDGARSEDRTYNVLFKKPTMERIDIVAGPGKGGGIVWLGGDKVKGHKGGFLSGIHLTLDIHNGQVVTLRGDAVDTATIPAMLHDFSAIKGTVSQAPGPQIDDAGSVAVTLDVADPSAEKGVSRIVLYVSQATHLPVRRERFAGTQLVKSENITEMKINVGLTSGDFPW